MSQTITIQGGNCYQLAADYLGDVTQFVQIMAANNLTDPFIASSTTLIIPDADPSSSGGTLATDSSYPYGYTE